jgi:glucosamine--fructose-6-phosphate aminotransferase (isomerizing)
MSHYLIEQLATRPNIEVVTGAQVVAAHGDVSLEEIEFGDGWWNEIDRIDMVACGTAWHACLVGKYYIEQIARVPCQVDYGSEFRYREPLLGRRDLLMVVSQSCETADTLAAVETARTHGARSLAICNVVDSSLARRCGAVLYTHAGPEISVASTKAFTTQLTALLLFAIHLGRRRGTLDAAAARDLIAHLVGVTTPISTVLQQEAQIEALARHYSAANDFLFLGRGISFPIALEGALKLKELSYIHAEGYPAGELKHGPIALINEQMPVMVIVPRDAVFAKTISNMKEVESRGGQIVLVTDATDGEVRAVAQHVIQIPTVHPLLMPLVATVPLQLFAYHVAVHRGTDVDQPRNLAKSVTVE